MDDKPLVSYDDLTVSNTLEIQALIRILVRQGITSEDEIMKEIMTLRAEMNEKIKKLSKEN